MKQVKSFCHLCLAECGIKVTVDQGKFSKISPDSNDPVSKGYVCEKSQRLIEFQHSPERITSPLKKINGKFVPISWEQAMKEVTEIIGTHYGDIFYMAPLSPSYYVNTIYNFELMSMLGANYASSVLSYEKAYEILTQSQFFSDGVYPDRENADLLISIGQNTWITQHYPRARSILNDIKNDPNRKLVIIDPVRTETAERADLHLQIRSGTDAWLLTAIVKTIIDRTMFDKNFLLKNTENFAEIKKHFAIVKVEDCLTVAGITVEQFNSLIDLIATSKGVCMDTGNGICHTPYPFANNYLITLIYLLTGSYNKPGTMMPFRSLPTPQQVFKKEHTPITEQKQYQGMMSSAVLADNLTFDCVVIDNTNPVLRAPNSTKFKEKLKKVKHVIALDSFHTESTRMADYVLPTPTFFERYEVVNFEHPSSQIAQLSEPVLSMPSYARTSSDIFEEMLQSLKIVKANTEKRIKELYEEGSELFYQLVLGEPSPFYILRNTIGQKYKDPSIGVVWWFVLRHYLKDYDFDQALVLTNSVVDVFNQTGKLKYHNQVELRDSKIDLTPHFMKSTLKFNFKHIVDLEYPFVVQCGFRQSKSMNEVIKNKQRPTVEISEIDAEEQNLKTGDIVKLESKSGGLIIKCEVVNTLRPKELRIANHQLINQLTVDNNQDYLSPQNKFVFVKLYKSS